MYKNIKGRFIGKKSGDTQLLTINPKMVAVEPLVHPSQLVKG
jgi:hypothetical protein